MLVHNRLCRHRVISFTMTMFAIADHVDDNVFVKFHSEIKRDLGYQNNSFRIVTIYMETLDYIHERWWTRIGYLRLVIYWLPAVIGVGLCFEVTAFIDSITVSPSEGSFKDYEVLLIKNETSLWSILTIISLFPAIVWAGFYVFGRLLPFYAEMLFSHSRWDNVEINDTYNSLFQSLARFARKGVISPEISTTPAAVLRQGFHEYAWRSYAILGVATAFAALGAADISRSYSAATTTGIVYQRGYFAEQVFIPYTEVTSVARKCQPEFDDDGNLVEDLQLYVEFAFDGETVNILRDWRDVDAAYLAQVEDILTTIRAADIPVEDFHEDPTKEIDMSAEEVCRGAIAENYDPDFSTSLQRILFD